LQHTTAHWKKLQPTATHHNTLQHTTTYCNETATTQPTVINWQGLNDKEKAELIPTLSTTDNWILLTHPQGASNKSQPSFGESQKISRTKMQNDKKIVRTRLDR